MRLLITLSLFLFSSSLFADWQLNQQKSSLSYVSVKNNSIGENNYFRSFSGKIDKSGKLGLTIDLMSVDTRYKIRDERMRGLFFETHIFPVAKVSGQVRIDKVTEMKTGDSAIFPTEVTLDLHGHKDKINSELHIVKVAKDRFLVTPESPILLNAQAFDLTQGIQRLMDAAKLNSISWVVPVSFVLEFEK